MISDIAPYFLGAVVLLAFAAAVMQFVRSCWAHMEKERIERDRIGSQLLETRDQLKEILGENARSVQMLEALQETLGGSITGITTTVSDLAVGRDWQTEQRQIAEEEAFRETIRRELQEEEAAIDNQLAQTSAATNRWAMPPGQRQWYPQELVEWMQEHGAPLTHGQTLFGVSLDGLDADPGRRANVLSLISRARGEDTTPAFTTLQEAATAARNGFLELCRTLGVEQLHILQHGLFGPRQLADYIADVMPMDVITPRAFDWLATNHPDRIPRLARRFTDSRGRVQTSLHDRQQIALDRAYHFDERRQYPPSDRRYVLPPVPIDHLESVLPGRPIPDYPPKRKLRLKNE
jgi:hypothetical protein